MWPGDVSTLTNLKAQTPLPKSEIDNVLFAGHPCLCRTVASMVMRTRRYFLWMETCLCPCPSDLTVHREGQGCRSGQMGCFSLVGAGHLTWPEEMQMLNVSQHFSWMWIYFSDPFGLLLSFDWNCRHTNLKGYLKRISLGGAIWILPIRAKSVSKCEMKKL